MTTSFYNAKKKGENWEKRSTKGKEKENIQYRKKGIITPSLI